MIEVLPTTNNLQASVLYWIFAYECCCMEGGGKTLVYGNLGKAGSWG